MRIVILICFVLLNACAKAQVILGVIPDSSPINLTNANIVAEGDSYNNGESNRLVLLSPFNTNGSTYVEYATGGQQLSQMLDQQATEVFPAFVTGRTNILIIGGHGNSIYRDVEQNTAANAVNDAMNELKLYVSNARAYAAANNMTLYVISTTLIPRDHPLTGEVKNALFNQLMLDFNVAFLADNDWLDGIIRPELEPMFATFESIGYDVDRVHPSAIGYDKMAQLKRDLIITL